jgi:WD40 repeat protein
MCGGWLQFGLLFFDLMFVTFWLCYHNSGSVDRSIRLWNAGSGACFRVLKGHQVIITHIISVCALVLTKILFPKQQQQQQRRVGCVV